MTPIFFIILFMNISHGAGDVAIPSAPVLFAENGIKDVFSPDSNESLLAYIDQLREELRGGDEWGRQNPLLRHARDLGRKNRNVQDHTQNTTNYLIAKRAIYSALARDLTGRSLSVYEYVESPFRFWNRINTQIPLLSEEELDQPIGMAANLESSFLYHDKLKRFYTPYELSKLTPREISHLDISESHPVWHTRRYMNNVKDPWGDIEDYIEDQVNKYVNERYGLNINYDIQQAQNIVFFRRLRDSGTSPKMTVQDPFNQRWKLKWGSEIQTQPIVNRLFVYLGGKYIDPTYALDPGKEGTILVLSDDSRDDCDHVSTVEMFKYCLLHESGYNFLVDPYIYSYGVISEENLELFQTRYHPGAEEIIPLQSLIGRHFVTFKTGSMAFTGTRILVRGGPTPGSFFGALEDRVARGLFLFNSWIQNIDAKDENNKGFLLTDFKGSSGNMYIESQHDLGSSLALRGHAGRISTLKTGEKFASITRSPLRGRKKLIIHHFKMYRPQTWLKATHSDLLWFAHQLANLSIAEIVQAVETSKWPDFMQELAIYKLVNRRNQLLRLLGPEDKIEADILPPNHKVDLRTEDSKRQVALRYGLDVNKWLEYLRGVSHVETILNEGELSSCHDSYFINYLEQHHFPEGIERRQMRRRDNRPLRNCIRPSLF